MFRSGLWPRDGLVLKGELKPIAIGFVPWMSTIIFSNGCRNDYVKNRLLDFHGV